MLIKRLLTASLIFGFFIVFAVSALLFVIYSLGPPAIDDSNNVTFVDRNNEVIIDEQRAEIQLEDMPSYLIDAIILAEDRHFYEHYGVDFPGIIRAVIKNIKEKQLKEGASTITQQLARNLYLSHEKTWSRKIKELFYTIRLEMFYTKETILTTYLNSIYFGHGAYGISEASEYFFNKQVSDLSIAEATMLVGIPKGPTYYSPYNNMENATNRQQFILQLLLRHHVISEAEYYTAIGEVLPYADTTNNSDQFAAYFIDLVWKEITDQLHLNKERLMNRNVTIHTTLDYHLQSQLENTLQNDILHNSELEIGVMTIDAKNGAIVQMSGGKNHAQSTFNRATSGNRMIGSTFKPILYYAALENGFTATTMLQSEPTSFIMESDVYEPSNYNNYYAYEPISLAQAIALSDNIYAVKTHLFLSPEVVIETAKKFGMTTELPNVASLALGSASVPLSEMVKAYATIANGGKGTTPYTVEKIVARDGTVIYEKKHAPLTQVLDTNKAFLLTHLMTGMFDRRLNGYMEVTGASMIEHLQHEFAGKSGTTKSDSWMIGFSPTLVSGVWVGYDDNRPLVKWAEKALAKQVWAKLMQEAHENERDKLTFTPPNGVIGKLIDVETGLLATKDCPVSRMTYFEQGTEPTTYCTMHIHEETEEENMGEQEKKPFYQQLLELFP